MQSLLAEASGLLVSSGLLFAASTYLASTDEAAPAAGSRDDAIALVNDALTAAKPSALALTPQLGAAAYEPLIHVLAKIGLRSEYSAPHLGLDVDLTHMLLPNLDFTHERKLFSDLVKVGLVLGAGEAHGFVVPGHFVLSCPRPQDSEFQGDLVARFQALMAIRDPHSAAARAAAVSHKTETPAPVATTPVPVATTQIPVPDDSTGHDSETSTSTAKRSALVEETPAKRTRRQAQA